MKSYSHWLHWNVTSNFHCSLHKTACLSDKTEIILATKASASMAGSRRLAFLFLGFKFQLLLLVWFYLFGWFVLLVIFFNLPTEVIKKFEIQLLSCPAKLIDLPHLSGNIPVLVKRTVQHCYRCHPHLFYISDEKENIKDIKLFNSRLKYPRLK